MFFENSDSDADLDRFWSVARKVFQFEEPARKFAHLRRLAEKTASEHVTSSASLQAEVAQLFRHCGFTSSERAFSVAWTAWYMNLFTEASLSESFPAGFDNIPVNQEVLAFGTEMQLNRHAMAWCQLIAGFQLPWHLAGASRLREDARAVFVNNFNQRLIADRGNSPGFRDAILAFDDVLREYREALGGEFLPNAILLVEGATELVIMPHIGKCLGISCNGLGLHVIAAGGANQVAKRFEQLRQTVRIPVFCMLDADAHEQAKSIRSHINEGSKDRLFVIEDGEIEDTFETDTFVRLLNDYMTSALVSAAPIASSELASGRKTMLAKRLLRTRASIDFDKVKFAAVAVEAMKERKDVPAQLQSIFDTISEIVMGEKLQT